MNQTIDETILDLERQVKLAPEDLDLADRLYETKKRAGVLGRNDEYLRHDRLTARTMQRVLAELPKELGSDWKSVPFNPTYGKLKHVDGAEVGFNVGGHRKAGRLTFHGSFPDGYGRDYGATIDYNLWRITCSVNKSSRVLAADVKRRLLTTYIPKYAEAMAAQHEHVRRHNGAVDLTDEYAEILKEQVYKDGSRAQAHEINGYKGTGPYCMVKVDEHSGTAKIELNRLEPAFARKVLKLLVQERAKFKDSDS
jgi:hypothetical protein